MKAILCPRYGPPSVFEVGERTKPVPKPKELLIRVCATEATKGDCELRSFQLPVVWTWLPMRLVMGITKPRNPVLGMYFSGIVEEVGSDVTRFRSGDEIFGATGFRIGAYGEYVCLSEDQTLVTKPTQMSFEEAATVPLGGLNAIHFMNLARIAPGEAVLVNGAGGSIGTFAIQIAKARGGVVTAVDAAHKRELLMALGAEHVVDYEKESFTEIGRKFDVIFDVVAGSSLSACLAVLNPGGRYVTANPSFGKMLRSPLTRLFSDKEASFTFAEESVEELLALKEMIEAGELKAPLDRVFPMEQAAQAHTRVETEQRLGAVVLAWNT